MPEKTWSTLYRTSHDDACCDIGAMLFSDVPRFGSLRPRPTNWLGEKQNCSSGSCQRNNEDHAKKTKKKKGPISRAFSRFHFTSNKWSLVGRSAGEEPTKVRRAKRAKEAPPSRRGPAGGAPGWPAERLRTIPLKAPPEAKNKPFSHIILRKAYKNKMTGFT